MQEHHNGRAFSEHIIQTIRRVLGSTHFCDRHKRRPQDFTRERHFCFMRTAVFLLQKTVRSVQLHLHEFFDRLGEPLEPVTASAWSQARLKLRHGAFIELNQQAILEPVYAVGSAFDVQRWRGHRLIGIDSSLIHLPNTEAMGQEFGWVPCQNQAGQCGRYAQGRLSVLTDLLNRMALQTLLVGWETGERALAVEHLSALEPKDIALLDRGFASYELFARFIARQRYFVCRCAKSGFAEVNRLFEQNQAGQSVIVEIHPPNGTVGEIRAAGLPERIKVRLVTLRLSTGELEVLATNLLDEAAYETAALGELYHYRWRIETYYGLLKGRLDLENFTGRSPEAVRQDVYATIFLSNLESVLTRPTQRQMTYASPPPQHACQVNRAVSFHALKSHIIELLLSQEPPQQVIQKLEGLFAGAPVTIRPNRKVARKKTSAWRSYWFQRHVRKSVF
jgi:Transposase DDE domain